MALEIAIACICVVGSSIVYFFHVLFLREGDPSNKLRVTFECKRPLVQGDAFVLFAVGTRGDVQPMIALGCELKKRGYTVCVCAVDEFESLVKSYGLLFASCGINSLAEQEAGWLRAQSQPEFLAVVAETYLPRFDQLGAALLVACQQHKPRCIVTGVYGLHIALDIAESCGAKIRGIKFMPEGITRYNPPFGTLNQPSPHLLDYISRKPKHVWNLFLHYQRLFRLVMAARRFGFTKLQNNFRKRWLNLPPVTLERLEAGGKYLPIMFAYSRQMHDVPQDWPTWHKVFGFFFTPPIPGTSLSREIVEFLEAAEQIPVVVITFGSMNSLQSAKCEIVSRACRACLDLGLRVILISVWGAPENINSNAGELLVVKSAPHELLFPQCDLIIHHGGAGTTARVAQAGVPSVVVPILQWLDQRGWAMVVENLGAGIHVTSPFIEQADLEAIIREVVVHPIQRHSFRKKAKELALHLQDEDDAVIRAVDWLILPMSAIEYDSRFRIDAIRRMHERSCLFS